MRVLLDTAGGSGRCSPAGVLEKLQARAPSSSFLTALLSVKRAPFHRPRYNITPAETSVESDALFRPVLFGIFASCVFLSADHAENEYCSLEGMGHAVKVLAGVIARLEKT